MINSKYKTMKYSSFNYPRFIPLRKKKMLLIDFKIFKRISLNCSKRKISTKIKISLQDRASYGYFCDWLWNRIFNNINRKFGGYKLPVISIAKDRYNNRLRNREQNFLNGRKKQHFSFDILNMHVYLFSHSVRWDEYRAKVKKNGSMNKLRNNDRRYKGVNNKADDDKRNSHVVSFFEFAREAALSLRFASATS